MAQTFLVALDDKSNVGRKTRQPTLTWLDLTARDRDRMQKLLNLFNEQGTVDEMGLGMIRDAFSAELFPGITSLQTHLRYVLFVPWIYKKLDTQRAVEADLNENLRRVEVNLIKPLAETGDTGVIGINAGANLQRRPSSIYWNCLRSWGIFQFQRSQGWYHSQRLRKKDRALGRSNDYDDLSADRPYWHPKLPEIDPDFPWSVTFELRKEEADFIQEQITTQCSGSLLAFLSTQPRKRFDAKFWDLPVIKTASTSVKETVELARRFSLFVESMPIVYNLMLAEQQTELAEFSDEATDRVEEYQLLLEDWIAEERREHHRFVPSDLWAFLSQVRCPVKYPTKIFINSWADRLETIGVSNIGEDSEIRELVTKREVRLKGKKRARLANPDRLRDWYGGSGLGRLDFNWFRAKELLLELYQGLENC